MQLYNGLIDAARGTVRNYGVAGLYAGINPTLLQIIPSAALQFGAYDQCQLVCKKWNAAFRQTSGRDLTVVEDVALTGIQVSIQSGPISYLYKLSKSVSPCYFHRVLDVV